MCGQGVIRSLLFGFDLKKTPIQKCERNHGSLLYPVIHAAPLCWGQYHLWWLGLTCLAILALFLPRRFVPLDTLLSFPLDLNAFLDFGSAPRPLLSTSTSPLTERHQNDPKRPTKTCSSMNVSTMHPCNSRGLWLSMLSRLGFFINPDLHINGRKQFNAKNLCAFVKLNFSANSNRISWTKGWMGLACCAAWNLLQELHWGPSIGPQRPERNARPTGCYASSGSGCPMGTVPLSSQPSEPGIACTPSTLPQ